MAHKKEKRTPFQIAQAQAAHKRRQQDRAGDGAAGTNQGAAPRTTIHVPKPGIRQGDLELVSLAEKFADASFVRRFRRADRELDAVVQDWRSWGSTVKTQTIDGGDMMRIVMRVDALPDSLHEHVGDCLENLRSALDQLVFALADRATGGLTDQQERSTSFPIRIDEPPSNDKRSWKGISLVPPAAADLIRAVQPYAAFPSDPRESPLSMLQVLAERSKHRAAISAATSGEAVWEPRNQHHIEIGHLTWSRHDLAPGRPNVVLEADRATMAQIGRRGAAADLRIRGSRSSVEDREIIAVLREIIAYVDTEVLSPLLRVLARLELE